MQISNYIIVEPLSHRSSESSTLRCGRDTYIEGKRCRNVTEGLPMRESCFTVSGTIRDGPVIYRSIARCSYRLSVHTLHNSARIRREARTYWWNVWGRWSHNIWIIAINFWGTNLCNFFCKFSVIMKFNSHQVVCRCNFTFREDVFFAWFMKFESLEYLWLSIVWSASSNDNYFQFDQPIYCMV